MLASKERGSIIVVKDFAAIDVLFTQLIALLQFRFHDMHLNNYLIPFYVFCFLFFGSVIFALLF